MKPLTTSRTLDSLAELQSTKINTPSMSSSGYGSQAVSTTNLTSDDSMSIKSISVDETPDLEYRNIIEYKKPEKMDSSLVEETPEEYLGEINTDIENLSVSQRITEDVDQSDVQPETNKRFSGSSLFSKNDCEKFSIQKLTDSNSIADKRNEMEISQASSDDSPLEDNSIVNTKLPPGKVVRRRKQSSGSANNSRTPTLTFNSNSNININNNNNHNNTNANNNNNNQHRASFPMVRPHFSESKLEHILHQPDMGYENGDNSSSAERIDDDMSDKNSGFGSRHDLTRIEPPLPDWVVVGESVMVRPYSYCGVIAYIGPTEFASGTWIGVELDAPTGTFLQYL